MAETLDNALDGTVPAASVAGPPAVLSQPQKAAVIVRLLLTQEVPMPLDRLSAKHQQRLAKAMTQIHHVDRATLRAVVDEFIETLDTVALSFPTGLADALDMLEPYLSSTARDELQSAADKANRRDSWDRLALLETDDLVHLMEEEGPEICAIVLSKLPVAKAAALLAAWSPDRAEAVTHAVALTGTVGPHTVHRIGKALVAQLDARPAPAFRSKAANRVGEILNAATRTTRDALLTALEARDEAFAEAVRRTLFTFADIPARLDAGDVPAVMRAVDGNTLALALASALADDPLAADFILENVSKRMAETLRDEATALGSVPTEEGEAAMAAVVTAIRDLETTGQIKLVEQVAAE
ncbi:MAG: FliG C-terminal domain-containing protein [Pseudomonadota bacterium]